MSFLIKCNQTGFVWLFNCPEGCQKILIEKKIKFSRIIGIIITNLDNKYIAGMIGLLSSLSLSSRRNKIKIYGPLGLKNYLQFLRKYSQTTFRYILEIYIIHHQYIQITHKYLLYIYPEIQNRCHLTSIFLEKEKVGKFKLKKAQSFSLPAGPLYGKLKTHQKLLLPNGQLISGKHFTQPYSSGVKILYLCYNNCKRDNIENMYKTDIVVENF